MNDSFTTEIEVPEPRWISVRFNGVFDANEAVGAFDRIDAAVASEPFFVIAADMRGIDTATPEARRITAERFRSLPDRAVAVIGGSFAQKMIAKIVLKAMAMLTGTEATTVAFFEERDAAEIWLRDYAARKRATAE